MGLLAPELGPFVAASVDEASAYLDREGEQSVNVTHWTIELLNAVAARLEAETGRNLVARSYRTPVTQAFTTTADSTVLTAGATANLKEFDLVVGTAILVGARLLNLDTATQATMTKRATAAGTPTLTFGSAPIVVDGRTDLTWDGASRIWAGEYPLHEVWSVKWRGADGVLTALDLTGMRIEKNTGQIILPNAAPVAGNANLEIECLAGYLPPKAGTTRGFDGYGELRRLTLRAFAAFYEDQRLHRGRALTAGAGPVTDAITSYKWPDDVSDGIGQFRRKW